MALRALQKRLGKLEDAGKPRPFPFTVLFGSFDRWVEREVLPGIQSGALDRRDMVAVVAALRAWEHDGTWGASASGLGNMLHILVDRYSRICNITSIESDGGDNDAGYKIE